MSKFAITTISLDLETLSMLEALQESLKTKTRSATIRECVAFAYQEKLGAKERALRALGVK